MEIRLSIIIPVYNTEKYLEECLDSVCNKNVKNTEIIIVDDCSNDNSLKISKKYKKQFNFVKLISLKKNRGVSYCRNIGIKKAVGDFVSFLDSDDKLAKNAIKIILDNINKFRDKNLFILKNLILQHKNNPRGIHDKSQTFNIKKKSLITCTINLDKFRPTCWNFIVKKIFLKNNEIKFRQIVTAEDWVFVSELICLSTNYHLIDKPVYLHRANEINSLGRVKGFIRAVSVIKVIYELLKFIKTKKVFLNNEKVSYILRIINMAIQEFYLNLGVCKKNDIKKLSSTIKKYKKTLLNLSIYGVDNFKFINKNENKLQDFLIKTNKRKDDLIKNMLKKIPNKRIILFCAGRYGRSTLDHFNRIGINIEAIVDNNTAFKNKKVANLKVQSISYLIANLKKFSNFKIFVCINNSSDYEKIKIQLSKIGYFKKNIIQFNLI